MSLHDTQKMSPQGFSLRHSTCRWSSLSCMSYHTQQGRHHGRVSEKGCDPVSRREGWSHLFPWMFNHYGLASVTRLLVTHSKGCSFKLRPGCVSPCSDAKCFVTVPRESMSVHARGQWTEETVLPSLAWCSNEFNWGCVQDHGQITGRRISLPGSR